MAENQEEVKQELKRQFFAKELKLVCKYPYSEEVKDVTLADLMSINTSKSNIIVPHTSGRYQIKRFKKIQCPIIERLKIFLRELLLFIFISILVLSLLPYKEEFSL